MNIHSGGFACTRWERLLVSCEIMKPTRVQANLGHTMPDGLIVDSDFKENYRT